MRPAPTPLGAPLDPDAAEVHRREGCSGYDHCLSLASLEGWEGWSCLRCAACTSRRDAHVVEVETCRVVVPELRSLAGRVLWELGREMDLEEGELAHRIGSPRSRVRQQLHELVETGAVIGVSRGRWQLARDNTQVETLVELMGRDRAAGRRVPPILVEPSSGGALRLLLGRGRLDAVRLLDWERLPVVVMQPAPCPGCGRYLRPHHDGNGHVQRRAGVCPECGELWGTSSGQGWTFAPVGGSARARMVRPASPCPYCGDHPAIRKGGCSRCRKVIAAAREAGAPTRRTVSLLRLLLTGTPGGEAARAVGLPWLLAVRVVEALRSQEEREQLTMDFDDDAKTVHALMPPAPGRATRTLCGLALGDNPPAGHVLARDNHEVTCSDCLDELAAFDGEAAA